MSAVPLTLLPDGAHKITTHEAATIVVANHYLHRRPPISHAFGWVRDGIMLGACTYGTPASRHLQMSACPSEPGLVIELNRLWVDDSEPRNTESQFVAATLKMLPPHIVVSYADTAHGHFGYIYRALSWRYAGWTDMDRKTPRFDYLPTSGGHSRDAMRGGWSGRQRREPKAKYWTTTGAPAQRRSLASLCGWPSLSWRDLPVPGEVTP